MLSYPNQLLLIIMPQYKRCTNDSTTLTKAGVRSVHPHDAWIMSLSNWYFCLSYRNFSQWLFSPIDAIHTLTRTINCGKLNCKTFLFVFFLLIQVMRYIIHVFCFNSKFMYVKKMKKKKKKIDCFLPILETKSGTYIESFCGTFYFASERDEKLLDRRNFLPEFIPDIV